MSSSLFLETNRLILRPLSFDDAASLQKLSSDRRIADIAIRKKVRTFFK